MPRPRRLAVLAGLLLAAAPALAAPDVPPDAVVGTLPFLDSPEPNRVYVDLAAEGAQPFRMMLDTGATHAVFTPLAARAAGVSVRATKSTPYRRKTRLGRDVQFYVDTSSSDTGSRTGWEYGLLGGDFLKPFVVELDFTMRSVRFIDPERWSVPEAAQDAEQAVVSMRDSTRPVIEIALGGVRIPILVDTGCPVPLVLSGKAAKQIGVDVDALTPFGVAATTLGPMEIRHYEAPDVEIAGFHFRNVPVMVAPKGWYGLAGEAGDSVIGYDLLSRFLVRVDYPHRRLWLRRESEQVTYLGVDYALTRESGAFLMPAPGVFAVQGILPSSPAARLGLRPGDLIGMTPDTKTPEKVLMTIRDGGSLAVTREEPGGILGDVVLQPTEAASR
jgi:predicted aspartyl protease